MVTGVFRNMQGVAPGGVTVRSTVSLVMALLALTTGVWAQVEIKYAPPQAGNVSLGIYGQDGRLVRALQSGKKTAVGEQKVTWDGRDDQGQPAQPGAYVLKGLVANLGWEYLLSCGNAGKPPYSDATGKGAWGGVWGNVMGVATEETSVYLLWAQEEGTLALLKVNPSGGTGKFVQWGAHNSWDWGDCQAVATDGEYVYVANHKEVTDQDKKTILSQVWRVRADTGEYAFYSPNKLLKVSELPAEKVPALPTFSVMCADATQRFPVRGWQNLFALAVDGQNLYCALQFENAIKVFDKQTGAEEATISVPAPRGIALAPEGNLYVVSGKQVLKATPAGQVVGPVVAQGLVAPYGVAVDQQGRIYVSDEGEAMQVKVFSPAGRQTEAIGKSGGRALGGSWAANQGSFLYPTHVDVAPDGTLYAGEDAAPKRVAIVKGGKVTDSWIGPMSGGCATMEIADAENPEYLYQIYHLGQLVRYKMDYARRTWALDAYWNYNVASRDDNLIKPNSVYAVYDGGGGYIRHREGRTYLFVNASPLSIWRVDGFDLRPIAAVGTQVFPGFPQYPRYGPDAVARVTKNWKSVPAGQRTPSSTARIMQWVWRDQNGDGEAQEGEFTWTEVPADSPLIKGGWGGQPYVDPRLNVYMAGFYLPCRGMDNKGIPLYDWSRAELMRVDPFGQLTDGAGAEAKQIPVLPRGRETNMWTDAQGFRYLEADVEGKGTGIGWASSGIYAKIGKAAKQGHWIWRAGDKATTFAKPGQFYKPGNICGLEKGCLFVCDWNGQVRVWDTATGLYVGSLLGDAYRGVVPDENVIHVEFTEGHVFASARDNRLYLVAGDGDGTRLFSIEGVEEVKRWEQPVTLGQVATAEAPPAPTAAGASKTAVEVQKVLRAPGPVKIDADLGDWNLSAPVGPVAFDPAESDKYNATFWAMYDDQNLYLAAKVANTHPPYNRWVPGTDWAWNGDSIIFRLVADATQALPVTFAESPHCLSVNSWHNNAKNQDYLEAYRGIRATQQLGQPAGAEVRFRPQEKGYTVELRMPWAGMRTGWRPTAGDRIAFTWEVGIGSAEPTNSVRLYQIFAVNGGLWAFTNPGLWGVAEFQ